MTTATTSMHASSFAPQTDELAELPEPSTQPALEPAPTLPVFPADGLRRLGYLSLREWLAGNCWTPEAQAYFQELAPVTDWAWVQRELTRTQEARQLLDSGQVLPVQRLPDINKLLAKAGISGSFLTPQELFQFLGWYQTVQAVRTFLEKKKALAPLLHAWLEGLAEPTGIEAEIRRVLDEQGEVRDQASTELAKIRKSLLATQEGVRVVMARVMRKAKQNGWTEEESWTLRNERMVVPIKAGFQGNLNGFVQDVSGTGQTVYLEPGEALELNNRVRELRLRERNELRRILLELTGRILPDLPAYRSFHQLLVRLDIAFTRGKLASQLNGQLPALETPARTLSRSQLGQAADATGPDRQPPANYRPPLELKQAQHPVLSLLKGAEQVIPFDLHLEDPERMLVISGPNAGGKSVTLQAVGLLQLMLQSGLLPTCQADSRFGLVTQLFVDLGDGQSVQNDLSTYTAHLTALKTLLDQLQGGGLFLLDELGAGTDPTLGGPLAEAVMDVLLERGALGVVTTHYSNLKELANQHPQALNAAMAFDPRSLQPQYQLQVGRPGSSYALEMAQRVGLPETILQQARRLIGEHRTNLEDLLSNLQNRELYLQSQQEEIENALQDLFRQQEQVDEDRRKLDYRRKHILNRARQDAAKLLAEANRRIENTIREIREQQAEKEATRKLRQELAEDMEALVEKTIQQADQLPDEAVLPVEEQELERLPAESLPEAEADALPSHQSAPRRRNQPQAPQPPANGRGAKLQVGDTVYVTTMGAAGELISLEGESATVAMGELHMRVRRNALQPSRQRTRHTPRASEQAVAWVEKASEASSRLDLRGKRVDQALKELEDYLDELNLSQLQQVVIVHGKGTGALRKAVRHHLQKQYSELGYPQEAPEEAGGQGVTLFRLREN